MLTPPQILFLQRLVKEKPTQRRAGDIATFLCDNFSLGTSVGRVVEYAARHHQMAEQLLRSHDVPVEAPGAQASRADIALHGGLSEKSLSANPHADSVAVRFVGHCLLAGQAITTAPGSYAVMTSRAALQVRCDRILVVENLETFRQLERYEWIDYRDLSVMVIYRGDRLFSLADSLSVISQSTPPLWAFFDFDPRGLAMANALPVDRFERLVLPPLDWLETVADTARGRELFAKQVEGCAKALARATHPKVQVAWAKMRMLRSAVTQERMRSAPSRMPRGGAE